MSIPPLRDDGTLPPGIYRATLTETLAIFGQGEGRQDKSELLRLIVEAAGQYPTIKRVLVWGSFVTRKPDPADLDYSVVVETGHKTGLTLPEHQRFLVPSLAKISYGVDAGYLIIPDYPLENYIERLDFLCRDYANKPRGILEIDTPVKE